MATRDTSNLSVFELTTEEEEKRLQDVTERLKKEIYAKGLPIVYQDGRCPTDCHFIEQYQDGKTYLVKFDLWGMKHDRIKRLPKA